MGCLQNIFGITDIQPILPLDAYVCPIWPNYWIPMKLSSPKQALLLKTVYTFINLSSIIFIWNQIELINVKNSLFIFDGNILIVSSWSKNL